MAEAYGAVSHFLLGPTFEIGRKIGCLHMRRTKRMQLIGTGILASPSLQIVRLEMILIIAQQFLVATTGDTE